MVDDRLVVINLKPIPNDLYVLEADPRAVEKLRLSHIVFELEESIKIKNKENFNRKALKKQIDLFTKNMEILDLKHYIRQLRINNQLAQDDDIENDDCVTHVNK